jgi:hypothetical protein
MADDPGALEGLGKIIPSVYLTSSHGWVLGFYSSQSFYGDIWLFR